MPTHGRGPRRRAAANLAVLALALGGAGAHAATLVSNIGQVQHSQNYNFDVWKRAQGFTTGSTTGGYTLTSIEVRFHTAPTASMTVQLVTGLPGGTTEVATLTNPASFGTGTLTFTAPENTTLTASTEYWVTVSGGTGSIRTTSSGNEDSGGQSGWSVANSLYSRSTGAWEVTDRAMMIRVNGDRADQTAPTFSSATVNGKTLAVTFNEALDSVSAPEGTAFAVSGGRAGTGTTQLSGATATVTLDSAVAHGQSVTVSYNSPGTGNSPLRDGAGNEVQSFSGQQVTNNTPRPPGGGTPPPSCPGGQHDHDGRGCHDEDEDHLHVSVGDVDVLEGTDEEAVFEITLSRARDEDMTIRYETRDGTAAAGEDYESASGELTIEAGTTSGTVGVPVLDDDLYERDEHFELHLEAVAEDWMGQARAGIKNDDPKPRASIRPEFIKVREGRKHATFTVELSAPAARPSAGNGDPRRTAPDALPEPGRTTGAPSETANSVRAKRYRRRSRWRSSTTTRRRRRNPSGSSFCRRTATRAGSTSTTTMAPPGDARRRRREATPTANALPARPTIRSPVSAWWRPTRKSRPFCPAWTGSGGM